MIEYEHLYVVNIDAGHIEEYDAGDFEITDGLRFICVRKEYPYGSVEMNFKKEHVAYTREEAITLYEKKKKERLEELDRQIRYLLGAKPKFTRECPYFTVMRDTVVEE